MLTKLPSSDYRRNKQPDEQLSGAQPQEHASETENLRSQYGHWDQDNDGSQYIDQENPPGLARRAELGARPVVEIQTDSPNRHDPEVPSYPADYVPLTGKDARYRSGEGQHDHEKNQPE